MRLKELLSFAKPIIKPTKIAFQVFFQPNELETYLQQHPTIHKRLFWQHVVIAVIFYVIWFAGFSVLFYEELGFGESMTIQLSIFVFICYIFPLIAGAGLKRLFKQEILPGFLFGIYWNIVGCIVLLGVFILNSLFEEYKILSSLQPFFGSIVLLAGSVFLVTLYGKTRGFYLVLLSAVFVSLLGTAFLIDGWTNFDINKEDVTYSLIQDKRTEKPYLKIDAKMPTLYTSMAFWNNSRIFNMYKLLLVCINRDYPPYYSPSTERYIFRRARTSHFLIDVEAEKDLSLQISELENFDETRYITLATWHPAINRIIHGKYVSYNSIYWDQLHWYAAVRVIGQFLHDKSWEITESEDDTQGFRITFDDKRIDIEGKYFYPPLRLNDTRALLHTDRNFLMIDVTTGTEIWEKASTENYDFTNVCLILKDNNILIESKNYIYTLDGKSGAEIWKTRKERDDFINEILVLDNDSIFLENSYTLRMIDFRNGNEIWRKFKEQGNATRLSRVLQNNNIFLQNTYNIQILDYKTGDTIWSGNEVWSKNLDGEYFQNKNSLVLHNNTIFLHDRHEFQLFDPVQGVDKIWSSTIQEEDGPIITSFVLDDNNIFLQTQHSAQVLGFKDGAVVWKAPVNWYGPHKETRPEQIAVPILHHGMIYGLTSSGELFALRASDGTFADKTSFYAIYAEKHGAGLYRAFFFMLAYYALNIIGFVCLGIYRIPVYLSEIVLQVMCLFISRKNVPKAIKLSPLFFDHISTVPLPFSRQLMYRIAAEDSDLYAEKLVYLLEKTHHQKLAATLFEEFHEQHQKYLFDYLYKTLQSENWQVLDGLTKQLQNKRPVGKLLHSYNQLLSTESKEFDPENHADILGGFVKNQYRFAQELYLTYHLFRTFLGFQNLQEIAQADQALADILKISYGDLLNVPLIETLRLIEELSNDLKNYDVVENYRDKQYFLSEARIKLYDISRRAEEELHNPERSILLEIVEQWEGLIIAESKTLRGPAELEISILSKTLAEVQEWSHVSVLVKNVGQSPAENVRISLLENENMLVLEDKKVLGLLGTGEAKQVEFSVRPQGNPDELRMYFDTVFDDFERQNKLRPFADIVVLSADVGEFRKIPNPFVVGTPVRSEKVFFGRRGSQDFAIENLSGGTQNNVLIYFGQRRVGKSSILYRLMETKLKDEYIFVYIDCQGFGEVDTAKLLYQICRKIHTAARQNQIIIERPNLKNFKEQTFVELDEYLDTVEAALEQKHIVLMFDEYEFLEYKVKDGNVSPEIFNKLRSLMQHRSKLAFIFAGTHRLTELTEDYWSILFNIALYREIGALNREASKALIAEPVKGYLRYDDLAVDKILRVSGLHPYFIQVICRLLVNYCNTQQVNFVTLATVNNILKEAVEGSTAHVKYLFKDYAADPEQEILTFLSRVTDESKLFASVTEIERFANENGFSYDRKQVMEVLASLKNKKLVKEGGEIRGEMYGFEIELLRLWIAEHVTIQRGFINLI